MMAQAITTLALAASHVSAEVVSCVMDDDVALTFAIDRNQFAPAVDENEPPRQQRTVVAFGEDRFSATPFLIGTTRGFEADEQDGTTTLFVMQADGTAGLSNKSAGRKIAGVCTLTEDAQ